MVGASHQENKRGATAKVITYGAIWRICGCRIATEAPRGSRDRRPPSRLSTGFRAVGRDFRRVATGSPRAVSRWMVREYPVSKNAEEHQPWRVRNFSRVIWRATPDSAQPRARSDYTSADGEEGFPGTLQVRVTYRLNEDKTCGSDLSRHHDKTTSSI